MRNAIHNDVIQKTGARPGRGPAETLQSPSAGSEPLTPPRPRTDLAFLRKIVLALEKEEGRDPERQATTISDEALAEIVPTLRDAAVELAYLRTFSTPGFVGYDGPRFSLDDDQKDKR